MQVAQVQYAGGGEGWGEGLRAGYKQEQEEEVSSAGGTGTLRW
jgi:hypothetical protein